MSPEMLHDVVLILMLLVALSSVWFGIKVVTRPHKRSKADQIMMDSQAKVLASYKAAVNKALDMVEVLKTELAKSS